MILEYINWNANPEIVKLGPISLRWYGLLFAMGFFLGYLIFQKYFRKDGITIEILDKLTIYMVLGTVIGARLGHCLFYDASYYLSNPLKILKVWEGGLASHGAAIGILIALWIFTRKFKFSYAFILDRIVITVALAGFFIRMGNLMNSEIYGMETHLPWGFIFLRNGEVLPKHPTQIYEGLCYLLSFVFLMGLYLRKPKWLHDGHIFGFFLILIFTARFFIEFIKQNQSSFEENLPLNMGQLLSIPFIIGGILIVYYAGKRAFERKVQS
jgi:phosphatidylglycerol---prolipoprotein diacylglyceryl transferase